MSKGKDDPPVAFDIDEIAARNLEEAKLRAKAFDLAFRIARWHRGNQCPAYEIAIMAGKIHKWMHTGEFPGGRQEL